MTPKNGVHSLYYYRDLGGEHEVVCMLGGDIPGRSCRMKKNDKKIPYDVLKEKIKQILGFFVFINIFKYRGWAWHYYIQFVPFSSF